MFDDTSTDFSDDIRVGVGCTLVYAFQVQPLDVTGATASFITSFGTFSVALSVAVEGDQSVSTFSVTIPPSSMPVPGLYTWKILVTFAGGQVVPYGNGGILVTP